VHGQKKHQTEVQFEDNIESSVNKRVVRKEGDRSWFRSIYTVVTSNVNGAEATNSTAQTINQCTFRET